MRRGGRNRLQLGGLTQVGNTLGDHFLTGSEALRDYPVRSAGPLGNDGALEPSGVDKVTELYRRTLEHHQDLKRSQILAHTN